MVLGGKSFELFIAVAPSPSPRPSTTKRIGVRNAFMSPHCTLGSGQGADESGKYPLGERRKALCEMKHFDACVLDEPAMLCCKQ